MSTSIIFTTTKINVKIKKSKKIIFVNFLNSNKTVEDLTSYKYLKVNIHHNIHCNYITTIILYCYYFNFRGDAIILTIN